MWQGAHKNASQAAGTRFGECAGYDEIGDAGEDMGWSWLGLASPSTPPSENDFTCYTYDVMYALCMTSVNRAKIETTGGKLTHISKWNFTVIVACRIILPFRAE